MNALENRGADRRKITLPADTSALVNLGRKPKSLHEGDLAVVAAVSMGMPTIPILQEILFERDSVRIFQPQRRAVQPLACEVCER
jgi:hypothetical protein